MLAGLAFACGESDHAEDGPRTAEELRSIVLTAEQASSALGFRVAEGEVREDVGQEFEHVLVEGRVIGVTVLFRSPAQDYRGGSYSLVLLETADAATAALKELVDEISGSGGKRCGGEVKGTGAQAFQFPTREDEPASAWVTFRSGTVLASVVVLGGNVPACAEAIRFAEEVLERLR